MRDASIHDIILTSIVPAILFLFSYAFRPREDRRGANTRDDT